MKRQQQSKTGLQSLVQEKKEGESKKERRKKKDNNKERKEKRTKKRKERRKTEKEGHCFCLKSLFTLFCVFFIWLNLVRKNKESRKGKKKESRKERKNKVRKKRKEKENLFSEPFLFSHCRLFQKDKMREKPENLIRNFQDQLREALVWFMTQVSNICWIYAIHLPKVT